VRKRVFRNSSEWKGERLQDGDFIRVLEEQDSDLEKRLRTWAQREGEQKEAYALTWEEVKKHIASEKNAKFGFKLLKDWTGQSLERAEKSGIRELPIFPGWYEIKEKVLKKRLKKDKEGYRLLIANLEVETPPGLQARKEWKFLGEKPTTRISEIEILQDELIIIIIIIHLLGLAPAGYLAAPDNGP
jgi:hypothetical protein